VKKIVIALVVLLVLGAAAYGGFVWYENRNEQKANSLSDTSAKRAAAAKLAGSPDGVWQVSSGSRAGYRVEDEILRGATITATGYTTQVTGSMTLADEGTTISDAKFSVDIASITSEGFANRDQAFQRVLDASQFPTARFTMAGPVKLASFPAEGVETKVSLSGTLELKGKQVAVIFSGTAVRGGNRIDVTALIPITYTDFGIENPSNGFAKIGDTGNIDVSLGLVKG